MVRVCFLPTLFTLNSGLHKFVFSHDFTGATNIQTVIILLVQTVITLIFLYRINSCVLAKDYTKSFILSRLIVFFHIQDYFSLQRFQQIERTQSFASRKYKT